MKRLYRYTISSFVGPFAMTFLICIFVFLMQFLWRYLDDLVGKGLETSVMIELMSYAALSMIPMALPLAVLLASIMTFGNLGERFELLAIKASGVSLFKIMRPLMFVSLGLGLFTFYMANDVIPVANAKFMALLYSVKEQRPEMVIKEGVFSQELPGFSIKVSDRDPETGALKNLMIYDHRQNNGNSGVIVADSGYLKMSENKQHVVLTLFNGENYTEGTPKKGATRSYPFRRELFSKEVIVVPVRDFSLERVDENFFKDSYKMMKNSQLSKTSDSLKRIYSERERLATLSVTYNSRVNKQIQNVFKPDSVARDTIAPLKDFTVTVNFDSIWARLSTKEQRNIIDRTLNDMQSDQRAILQYEGDMRARLKLLNRHIIEWHRKYTLGLACILFFFIGAPLGAIIRKGGFGMPVVISIILFILYYVISLVGEKVAREGYWSVATAMWISSIVFIPIGIFFTYQAVTDSTLLLSDAYKQFFNKINIFKSKKRKNGEHGANENTGSVQ